MTRIEKKSTLTPVSGYVSPGLLCVEVVDRKLRDYVALGKNTGSIAYSSHLMHSDSSSISTTTTTLLASSRVSTVSPTATVVPPLSFDTRVAKKQKRRDLHCLELRNSIASRLPVRSQATVHRRLCTAIARNLPPRTTNRATQHRTRTWANADRNQGSRNIRRRA